MSRLLRQSFFQEELADFSYISKGCLTETIISATGADNSVIRR